MGPELRLLRYFVAVAEELSFTQAAARLYISQPSLSSAIKQLELSIPARLFERDTRHVALTPAGEAMLEHARAALEAAARAVQAAQVAEHAAPEVCRVLYTMPLETVALDGLDRLEEREQIPLVTARGVWSGEVTSDLLGGRADAALIRFPDPHPDFEVLELRGDRVCVLVGDRHPLASADEVVVEALAEHPTVRWADGLGFDNYNAFVRGVFRDRGLDQLPCVVNRADVPSWLPVVRGKACALVGSSERTPGGTRKVRLRDAPRMPINVCRVLGGAGAAMVAPLLEAMQQAVDVHSFA